MIKSYVYKDSGGYDVFNYGINSYYQFSLSFGKSILQDYRPTRSEPYLPSFFVATGEIQRIS